MKNKPYNFLPFRFSKRTNCVLLTNEVGDHHFLPHETFNSFIKKELDNKSQHFMDLKSKNFLYDGSLSNVIEILATQYRTKNQFLYQFTNLHMFVVTLRCNQKCTYCHASSQTEEAGSALDMDEKTAQNSVDIAFQSPSQHIKIEFQGGEPLLNFSIIKYIVTYAKEINEIYKKNLEFVVCTNLVSLTQEHLDFFKENNIVISTSLDGNREIHNMCRQLRKGSGSYDYVVPNIQWALTELGKGRVTALMTVTPHNVHRLKDVVDEYLRLNLEYIFIRKLNPLGYAFQNKSLDYSVEDFMEGYKDVLNYIISLNLQGVFFPEVFATIILSRILTPFSTGFVDLQSPAGVGIGGVIYDINGDVFVSDEARMMNRTTGNKYFCIGNVHQNKWEEIFCSPKLMKIIESSCIDALPGCAWCVYKPYCGGDPVKNLFSQGDMIGYRPTNEFCHKHYAFFTLLFDYLEKQDNDINDVFWSWITNRGIDQIRNYTNPIPIEEEKTI